MAAKSTLPNFTAKNSAGKPRLYTSHPNAGIQIKTLIVRAIMDKCNDDVRIILAELRALDFFAGTAPETIEVISENCARHHTLFDPRIARLFFFDLEGNADSCGEELTAETTLALDRLYPTKVQIQPIEGPSFVGRDWQEYATLIGKMLNEQLASKSIPERVYLTRFSENSCGGLFTGAMAQLVIAFGAHDPEAATLYLAS